MNIIDKDSSIPRYHQLEEILKDKIMLDEMKHGDVLPSVRQLIKEHSVSLSCVRQALSNLEQEGIISIDHGKSTTVASLPKKIKIRNIAFLLCNEKFLDLYCSRVLRGVENEIRKKKVYHLLYHQLNDYNTIEFLETQVPLFRENRVDGIVLVGEINRDFLSKLGKTGIPVVTVGDTGGENPLTPEESMTTGEPNFLGSCQAVSHLIELGHRNIGFIGISKPYLWFQQRFNGYKFALGQHNLSLNKKWLAYCATEKEADEGYDAMNRILPTSSLPTALFIADVRLAIGAIKRIKEANLKIPEDISLVSYGNLGLSSLTDPSLTTVERSDEEFGRKTVQALFAKISQGKSNLSKVVTEARLVIRSSTGKPINQKK